MSKELTTTNEVQLKLQKNWDMTIQLYLGLEIQIRKQRFVE